MNKFILILFLPFLFSKTVFANSSTVSVSTFGIIPGKDCTDGFIKLNAWIENKSDVTLLFSKGIYWVGRQKLSTTRVTENIDNILVLKNCSNIKLIGNGATIKYNAKLKFGTFDIKTKLPLPRQKGFLKTENAAWPGNCILIHNAKQISIENLTLDGNIQNMDIGGSYGDTGIQLWHRGIYLINSTQVTLTKLNIHHFGLDGIEISNGAIVQKQPKHEILLKNVKCLYNGRQGLSWTGGEGLTVLNSEFSHTGKSVLASSPGCGLDIEPETGECMNGRFVNCKFENNTGYAYGSEHFKLKISDIRFDNCIFGGSTYGALFPNNGGVEITNSTIYGQIIRPGGVSATLRVVIKNSKLYDYNPYTNAALKFATNHLVDAGSHESFFDFINCEFYLSKVKLCYIETGLNANSDAPIFRNNKINFNYTSFTKNDFIALFRGCILENNSFIIKSNSSWVNGHFLLAQGTMNKGTNRIQAGNSNIGWNKASGVTELPLSENK
ncbi:MAG TPA: right-handed parallel beta-helix repeat-containing protein [Chitinophagaceae bacterium]|nr:right-handed parallel beta-helix repeat-containing protein [Chitinophagaceae bacterium]